jgi:ADP-heptose:LPS heptosyltransferase
MRALDLIISIDSMPAHLAGALALPTWTLLQKDADWRWMDDRESSPWYPTMRLFRQRRSGDWQPVIARVKLELARLVEKRDSRFQVY